MASKPTKNRLNSKAKGQSQQVQDLQIWRLHQKIVEKIEQDPTLCTQVQQCLEQRLDAGQIRHGAYLYWSCLLLEVHQQRQFREGVLSMEPRVCKYRRRTPFVGILTEQERQQILYGDLQSLPLPSVDRFKSEADERDIWTSADAHPPQNA